MYETIAAVVEALTGAYEVWITDARGRCLAHTPGGRPLGRATIYAEDGGAMVTATVRTQEGVRTVRFRVTP